MPTCNYGFITDCFTLNQEHVAKALPCTSCSPKKGRCGPNHIKCRLSSKAKGISACTEIRKRHWGNLLYSFVSRMVVHVHERVTQLEQV